MQLELAGTDDERKETPPLAQLFVSGFVLWMVHLGDSI
jgi:hypothetical protein